MEDNLMNLSIKLYDEELIKFNGGEAIHERDCNGVVCFMECDENSNAVMAVGQVNWFNIARGLVGLIREHDIVEQFLLLLGMYLSDEEDDTSTLN